MAQNTPDADNASTHSSASGDSDARPVEGMSPDHTLDRAEEVTDIARALYRRYTQAAGGGYWRHALTMLVPVGPAPVGPAPSHAVDPGAHVTAVVRARAPDAPPPSWCS